MLSRRLQTLAFVKGLSFTPRQARQFIIHGHVSVGGRTVKVAGYLVNRGEEPTVAYDVRSPISSDLHPVRQAPAGERALAAGDAERAQADKGE